MDISNLNEEQRQAVLANNGPLMILAGAGSGKTRTLVSKMAYLLEDQGLHPSRILALTFSNKAAKEMRDRIELLVQCSATSLRVGTFHSFCARVLRFEAEYLGLSKNFTIYDTAESKIIVKSLLRDQGISPKEISPFEILNFIDQIKNAGLYDGKKDADFDPYKRDGFFPFYQKYQAELRRANALDFGGLVTGVIQLFETFPEVLKRYQDRFEYILVDEYQDTNRAQFQLIKLIAQSKQKICVVGDEDQSIYSWRGADINNILDFEKLFPDTRTIKLEQNYRSSKVIIEAAGGVIAKNTLRKGKQMWTDNVEGEAIDIVECYNDKREAQWIVEQILLLHEKQNVNYRDIAVFYRANSQSRIIEDTLRSCLVPYRVVGGIKFYERKEIKDLLAYLAVVINYKDSLSFSRIINVPPRDIGAKTLRNLEDEAGKNNLSLFEICEVVLQDNANNLNLRLRSKVKSTLKRLVDLINEIKEKDKEGAAPSLLYEKILHDSGYYNYIKSMKDHESQARIENLGELGSAIAQYEEGVENPSLAGFLETIYFVPPLQGMKDSLGEINLMTIHSAKGLEFSHVFVAGMEENIFPSYKSLQEGKYAEEEERRLFYVAMTRAMERLYLSFAQGRMLFGQIKFNGPSRFLYEVPSNYCRWEKLGESFSSDEEYEGEEDGEKIIYRAPKSKFPKGARVVHSLYGKGLVLQSEGIGEEEKVVIKFNGGAKKKFMVKFAPLTMA